MGTLQTFGEILVMRVVKVRNRQNLFQHRDVLHIRIFVIGVWHLHEVHLFDLESETSETSAYLIHGLSRDPLSDTNTL